MLAGASHSTSSGASAQILRDSKSKEGWFIPVSARRTLHSIARGTGKPSEALHTVASGELSEVLQSVSSGASAHDLALHSVARNLLNTPVGRRGARQPCQRTRTRQKRKNAHHFFIFYRFAEEIRKSGRGDCTDFRPIPDR